MAPQEVEIVRQGTSEFSLLSDPLKPLVVSGPPVPRVVDLTCPYLSSVAANPVTPHRFENDQFKGEVLIKLKTDPVSDLYEPYFHGKKRMFEIQVQGQCKSDIDAGNIFIGLEVAEPVRLAGFTKIIAGVIRKFIHAFNSHASTSFGDNKEVAHITLPMLTTVDRLVVSQPEEDVPELGVDMLPETMTKDQRAHIKSLSPDNIYSISMHGMYVDFAKWSVVHIPGIPDVSLSRFLGDLPLSIVCYTLKDAKLPHRKDNKEYLFAFELTPPPPAFK